jgi:hypothetical protein
MRVNDRNFIVSEVHNASADSEKPGKRVGKYFNTLSYERVRKV